MKVEIYVQARMGSSRLPGKVLRPVLGKPLLGYQLERIAQVKNAQAFAVLTTISQLTIQSWRFVDRQAFFVIEDRKKMCWNVIIRRLINDGQTPLFV